VPLLAARVSSSLKRRVVAKFGSDPTASKAAYLWADLLAFVTILPTILPMMIVARLTLALWMVALQEHAEVHQPMTTRQTTTSSQLQAHLQIARCCAVQVLPAKALSIHQAGDVRFGRKTSNSAWQFKDSRAFAMAPEAARRM